MLTVSIVFGLALFAWLGLQFWWAGSCGLSIAVVLITLLFVLFWYIASFLQCCNVNLFRKNATVFTVTLASIYVVYLTWSAMASNYNSECQLNMNDNKNTALQIVIGLVFTFITISSIAVASNESVTNGQKSKNTEEVQSVGGDLVAEKSEDCK